jgi:hypothetical protein
LGGRIRNRDDCRGIIAMIFRHYYVITGQELRSYNAGLNENSPNCIDHDNRCHFAGILAAAIGERPNTDFFENDIKAAIALDKYEQDKDDIDESEILIELLSFKLTRPDEDELPAEIQNKVAKFASIVTASVKRYKKINPGGTFSIEYLYSMLQ